MADEIPFTKGQFMVDRINALVRSQSFFPKMTCIAFQNKKMTFYFGKAYFEQGFGRRIADLPNTTKLANGIRLMRSDSALDWESPEDRERTQSLMDTLGRDWFFTKETGMPDKALKTDKSLFLKPLSR
jgi:hypothetical protein